MSGIEDSSWGRNGDVKQNDIIEGFVTERVPTEGFL